MQEWSTEKGYKFPAQFVIHTVGPRTEESELLASCYKTSLNLAVVKNIRTIAFACISTGIYGYPNKSAAIVVLKTVREWLQANGHNIDRIILTLCTKEYIEIYHKLMPIFFPIPLCDCLSLTHSPEGECKANRGAMPLNTRYNNDEGPIFRPHWRNDKRPYWAELHWKPDDAYINGRRVPVNMPINEFCKDWLDPKLPDGVSVLGTEGKDSMAGGPFGTSGPTQGWKHFKPIPVEQFQKEVYNTHPLIKEINSKWDISPQHPGITINRNTIEPNVIHPKWIGTDFWDPLFGKVAFRGPRFFDSPLNEKCHEKGIAGLKWGWIMGTTWYLIMHTIEAQMRMNFVQILQHYATKFIWYPTVLGGLWATSICACASVREEDDMTNGVIAGAFIAAIHGLKVNSKISAMFVMAMTTLLYAGHWQNRTSDAPYGRTTVQHNWTHGKKFLAFAGEPSQRGLPPPDW